MYSFFLTSVLKVTNNSYFVTCPTLVVTQVTLIAFHFFKALILTALIYIYIQGQFALGVALDFPLCDLHPPPHSKRSMLLPQ